MTARARVGLSLLVGLLAAEAVAGAAAADEFFLISSLDLARGMIVVKRPTEVTLILRVDAATRCRGENGRPMRLSDLRAGDTVFVISDRDSAGQLVARSVRLGGMTVPELQRRYLRSGR